MSASLGLDVAASSEDRPPPQPHLRAEIGRRAKEGGRHTGDCLRLVAELAKCGSMLHCRSVNVACSLSPALPGESRGPGFFCFKAFFVCTLANRRNRTLYIGHAEDIHRRVSEHKARSLRGSTAKYDVDRLVWCESHESRESTSARERRMKTWQRAWKLELIERFNPAWRDLFEDFN